MQVVLPTGLFSPCLLPPPPFPPQGLCMAFLQGGTMQLASIFSITHIRVGGCVVVEALAEEGHAAGMLSQLPGPTMLLWRKEALCGDVYCERTAFYVQPGTCAMHRWLGSRVRAISACVTRRTHLELGPCWAWRLEGSRGGSPPYWRCEDVGTLQPWERAAEPRRHSDHPPSSLPPAAHPRRAWCRASPWAVSSPPRCPL